MKKLLVTALASLFALAGSELAAARDVALQDNQDKQVSSSSETVYHRRRHRRRHLRHTVASKSRTVAGKSEDIGEKTVDKSKTIGGNVADKSKDIGEATVDKSKTIGSKVGEKSTTVARRTKHIGRKVVHRTKQAVTPQ